MGGGSWTIFVIIRCTLRSSGCSRVFKYSELDGTLCVVRDFLIQCLKNAKPNRPSLIRKGKSSFSIMLKELFLAYFALTFGSGLFDVHLEIQTEGLTGMWWGIVGAVIFRVVKGNGRG